MDIGSQIRRRARIKRLKVHLITSILTLLLILLGILSKRVKIHNNVDKIVPVITNHKNK